MMRTTRAGYSWAGAAALESMRQPASSRQARLEEFIRNPIAIPLRIAPAGIRAGASAIIELYAALRHREIEPLPSMPTPYPSLFAPFTLAGKSLRNRVVHASMTTHMAHDRRVTDQLIRY